MMSPLEYLFFAMMSVQNPDPTALTGMNQVEPAAGPPRNITIVEQDGFFEMRTILMEPRDEMAARLEAPMRITPEWIAAFPIGAPLSIKIDATDKTYDAHIDRIVSITDASGITVQVIAELNQPAADLEPGMTAMATMAAAKTTETIR